MREGSDIMIGMIIPGAFRGKMLLVISWVIFTIIGVHLGWSIKTLAPVSDLADIQPSISEPWEDRAFKASAMALTQSECLSKFGNPRDRQIHYDVDDIPTGEHWVYRRVVRDYATRRTMDAHVWFDYSTGKPGKVNRVFFYLSDDESSIFDY